MAHSQTHCSTTMTISTAFTSKTNIDEAVAELRAGLGAGEHQLILYFASSSYESPQLARAVHNALAKPAGGHSIGCTTAGEISTGQMSTNSIVAMAFSPEVIEQACVARVTDAKDPRSVDAALSELSKQLGGDVKDLPAAQYCGIALHDGLSVGEEVVMERLSDRTNVPFVGGSAGDDAKFAQTFTFMDGESFSGGSALAILKPAKPFHILKTQSFDVLDDVLVATSVDEATRTIHEFNGKPAVAEYARVLGVPEAQLQDRFMTNPVGLVTAEGEPFVRSPQQTSGSSVVFYCRVLEGMELRVLRSRNIVEDTKRDLTAKVESIGSVSGVVNFHCILRTLELIEKKQTEDYGKIFTNAPTVGFSTYGESYVGHINQTSTMLLFE